LGLGTLDDPRDDRHNRVINWGKAMPQKQLEQQFQAELAHRRQQSRREYWRSRWHQGRLVLGYLAGTAVIVGLATTGLESLTRGSANRPSTNPSAPPDASLTPVALPPTAMINQSWSQALAPDNSGTITIYTRPTEATDQTDVGKHCSNQASNQDIHHFVKIIDWDTQKVVQSSFVRANDKLVIQLPFGNYKVRIASGKTWYGEPHHFGRTTRYGELAKPHSQEATKLNLTQPSDWSIVLSSCVNGNLGDKPIRSENF
jgi:hypothetical protein